MNELATQDELKMAELAIRKQDLQDELSLIREEMRELHRTGTVILPLFVVLNGRGVMLRKPAYSSGPVQCQVSKVVQSGEVSR